MTLRACRLFEEGGAVRPRLVDMSPEDLSPGEVVLRVLWSGVNYKDALAVTGRGKILKRFPLNAGIDAAGIVESSADARFRPGDSVLVNGMGLGESHDGGFAELVRVPADWVVPLPAGLTLRESMTLGTAGFTAGLAISRMELNGQSPGKGEVVVTGATGGVGSAAVSMLAGRGYRVLAVSGRPEHHAYLRRLGAAEVKTPAELDLGSRPLEAARFGGVVDNVGGELLAGLLRHVSLWGQVACIGMAASPRLEGTVFPLILRGVSLLGVSSGNCPMPLRHEVWRRLGADLKPARLDEIAASEVPLERVLEAAEHLVERRALGRVLVSVSPSRSEA
ncbi:MAG TPA: YhdH/YhfP family quinone oxidoreductase [Vicinamibacteria bacterium]|nr:YhdH/YhfP family quinone oxidoreductase [Vicinamibacteria bacterium]